MFPLAPLAPLGPLTLSRNRQLGPLPFRQPLLPPNLALRRRGISDLSALQPSFGSPLFPPGPRLDQLLSPFQSFGGCSYSPPSGHCHQHQQNCSGCSSCNDCSSSQCSHNSGHNHHHHRSPFDRRSRSHSPSSSRYRGRNNCVLSPPWHRFDLACRDKYIYPSENEHIVVHVTKILYDSSRSWASSRNRLANIRCEDFGIHIPLNATIDDVYGNLCRDDNGREIEADIVVLGRGGEEVELFRLRDVLDLRDGVEKLVILPRERGRW